MIMAKDPICNMEVEEEKAEFVIHLHSETLYFVTKIMTAGFLDAKGNDHYNTVVGTLVVYSASRL